MGNSVNLQTPHRVIRTGQNHTVSPQTSRAFLHVLRFLCCHGWRSLAAILIAEEQLSISASTRTGASQAGYSKTPFSFSRRTISLTPGSYFVLNLVSHSFLQDKAICSLDC